MAKKNLLFFLVIGLLILFFLLIFTSGQNYLPHDNEKQYANYEPFDVAPNSTDVNSGLSPVDSSEIIDPISNAATNKADGNVCTGLTNTGGPVCLTPELVELLKTRGGNASGKLL